MEDEQIINNEENVNPDESQKEVELANPLSDRQAAPETEESSEQIDEQEQSSDESEEDKEEEEKPPSRREQLRIQQLLKKYGNPQDQQPSKPTTPQGIDYEKTLDADPELIKKLQEDRQQVTNVAFNEGLSRADYIQWEMGLRVDAPVVANKYPILDKNSPEFHPAVADAVNTFYLQMSQFDAQNRKVGNPGISYAEFVDSYMELVEETATQKNVRTVKNVAKQAATTGLRPDGSQAKKLNLNKAPQDMTDEELYAVLGQKPPTKK